MDTFHIFESAAELLNSAQTNPIGRSLSVLVDPPDEDIHLRVVLHVVVAGQTIDFDDLTRQSVIYVVGGRIQIMSEQNPVTIVEGDLSTVPSEPFSVTVMADATLLIAQSVTKPSVVALPPMTVAPAAWSAMRSTPRGRSGAVV